MVLEKLLVLPVPATLIVMLMLLLLPHYRTTGRRLLRKIDPVAEPGRSFKLPDNSAVSGWISSPRANSTSIRPWKQPCRYHTIIGFALTFLVCFNRTLYCTLCDTLPYCICPEATRITAIPLHRLYINDPYKFHMLPLRQWIEILTIDAQTVTAHNLDDAAEQQSRQLWETLSHHILLNVRW